MPSRFFWLSLLRWSGALVIMAILIVELVFPTSFGILPLFRFWKLALNGALLIGWIISFGYILRTARAHGGFPSQSVSFRRAFLGGGALSIGMALLLGLEILTDGKPLDTAIQFGLFMGVLFCIASVIGVMLSWLRHRRAK